MMPESSSEPAPAFSAPSYSDDLCALPAVEMARLVRSRKVSPRELVKAHLDRIAQVESKVGAFQVVSSEAALAEADALVAHPRLRDLPLAGVPVAIKDNIDVKGVPTRLGSAATRTASADADDLLVARLREAGCVIIGKTQLPELAIWPVTEPAAYPPTRNPWDLRKTAGGSTGGGAAAVVSGMAALALGSDGGGSLRIPAACCGVVGFKPGRSVVPIAGGSVEPLAGGANADHRGEHWLGLTEYGPIARTVDDAALMLDVLAGKNAYRDPRPLDHPVTIAFSARHPLLGVKASSRVISELDDVAALLRNAGHSLIGQSPPYPLTLGLRFNTRWLSGIAQDAAELDFTALEPRTQAMVKVGRFLARRAKSASADPYGRRAGRWFGDYEALITPTLTSGPGPVGAFADAGWFATMLKSANWIYTPPWNLAGLPAASVPFGHDDDGLPIGIQLVGPAGSEARLLSLAAQIEQLRPWPHTVPGAPG